MEEKNNNAMDKAERLLGGGAAEVKPMPSPTVEKSSEKVFSERQKREKKLLKQRKRAQERMKKMEAAAVRREQKNKEKQHRKSKNKSKNGGYVAAIVSLGVFSVVLAGVLTFTLLTPVKESSDLEYAYRRSFYDAVEQVDNIDLNLSKTLASKDSYAVQNYLLNLAVNSEVAENDFQSLPLKDENKFYTTKIVNQVGDYAKYLNKKLARGEELSSSDKAGLRTLYTANLELKNALYKMLDDVDGDFNFTDMEKIGNNFVTEGFNELQNLSVEYPELIYDGPFSDGIEQVEVKGLFGEEVKRSAARETFASAFAFYGIGDVCDCGETVGKIPCYNFSTLVNEEELYASVSKIGGKIISFSYPGSCRETVVDEDTALEKATEFLSNVGIRDVKAVWSNLDNGLYTFNLVYEEQGVVFYPDMVKVRVCAETGTVIGMDAVGYYLNHTDRSVPNAKLGEAAARKYLSDDLSVQTVRLAVVATGKNSERLSYEFCGEADGDTYYIYIDAENGRQLEAFKVIVSQDGKLLA